jgi:hypothetical protein
LFRLCFGDLMDGLLRRPSEIHRDHGTRIGHRDVWMDREPARAT